MISIDENLVVASLGERRLKALPISGMTVKIQRGAKLLVVSEKMHLQIAFRSIEERARFLEAIGQ